MDRLDEEYGRRTARGEEPRLRTAIARAELAMLKKVREAIPAATIFSFGAIDLFPGSLAFWVRVPTDAERDGLLKDQTAFDRWMVAILLESGYPEDSVGRVAFTAESDETVNREHGGNWWYAIK
jgi:hypothetical protein